MDRHDLLSIWDREVNTTELIELEQYRNAGQNDANVEPFRPVLNSRYVPVGCYSQRVKPLIHLMPFQIKYNQSTRRHLEQYGDVLEEVRDIVIKKQNVLHS